MNERQQRYQQKMQIIAEKIKSLPETADNALAKDATLYRTQVAIEAVMDIIAMLVKDKGVVVGDDYQNIEKLKELGIINSALEVNLKKINGLRNAIVHKYNHFEEDAVLKNRKNIEKIIYQFLEITEHESKTIT